MKSEASFRVSLNVLHPKMTAAEILEIIGLQPRYAHSVGQERFSKSGVALGGSYAETSLSFRLHKNPIKESEGSLCDIVSTWVEAISEKPGFSQLSESGGTIFFLLGLFCENNVMLEFKPSWMAGLAERNIGLKLDFYGGPD